ncbi:hypothetical protein FLAV_01739 [Flavobacteriales bacterium]|nr:hypothetical protein [Flavobacteriales bacterium]CAG0980456.1 hypothetical protein FLAV_01739 [Flavobacteriales bacterium]
MQYKQEYDSVVVNYAESGERRTTLNSYQQVLPIIKGSSKVSQLLIYFL